MIGLEGMLRDQERAAGQLRDRREDDVRGRGGGALPKVVGAGRCVDCRAPVAGYDQLYSARGPLCPTCFGEEESRAAVARLPGDLARVARSLTVTAPALGVAAFGAWVVAPSVLAPGVALTLKNAFAWPLATGLVLLASAVVALTAARELSLAWRRPVDEARRWLPVVVAAVQLAAVSLVVAVAAWLVVLPFLAA